MNQGMRSSLEWLNGLQRMTNRGASNNRRNMSAHMNRNNTMVSENDQIIIETLYYTNETSAV